MSQLEVWFSFSGRIDPKTYWLNGVLLPLCSVVIFVIVGFIVASLSEIAGNILFILWFLTLIVLSTAVAVKRLHDRNRTGWWLGPLLHTGGWLLRRHLAVH